jgi:hypothetical protein
MVVLPPQITSQPKDYFRIFIRELHDTTSCFGGQVLFSALVVFEGGQLSSEKEVGEGGSGSLSVSKGGGMGFGHEKSGSANVLLRCRQNPAAWFERCQTEQESSESRS